MYGHHWLGHCTLQWEHGQSCCVIKVGFVVPDVTMECTNMAKHFSAKGNRDEDRGEWEQNHETVFRCGMLMSKIT
jgi:hypothetical protein